MSRINFKTFSATGFQIAFNQLLGLGFFALMAIYIPKNIFGNINWSLAVSYSIAVFATFGLDHIVVKRISSGYNSKNLTELYLFHEILISFLLIFGMISFKLLFYSSNFSDRHALFPSIFTGILISFMSTPFKQLCNGLEQYWYMAYMNVVGNLIKFVFLLILIISNQISYQSISFLFLISGVLEFVVNYFLALRMTRIIFRPRVNIKEHLILIKESLPQMGAVFLNSALARLDIVLLGILLVSSDLFIAHYGFAYKAFESSRMPLLILAPILLPKFSKFYNNPIEKDHTLLISAKKLWILQAVLSFLIPIILVSSWVELINFFTKNKYGVETQNLYFILAFTIPLAYMSNYFWAIIFAQGKLKENFIATLVVTFFNLLFNLVLIPHFQAIGAAIAWLLSSIIQTTIYYWYARGTEFYISFIPFVKAFIAAVIALLLISHIKIIWQAKPFLAVLIYLAFILLFKVVPKYFIKNVHK